MSKLRLRANFMTEPFVYSNNYKWPIYLPNLDIYVETEEELINLLHKYENSTEKVSMSSVMSKIVVSSKEILPDSMRSLTVFRPYTDFIYTNSTQAQTDCKKVTNLPVLNGKGHFKHTGRPDKDLDIYRAIFLFQDTYSFHLIRRETDISLKAAILTALKLQNIYYELSEENNDILVGKKKISGIARFQQPIKDCPGKMCLEIALLNDRFDVKKVKNLPKELCDHSDREGIIGLKDLFPLFDINKAITDIHKVLNKELPLHEGTEYARMRIPEDNGEEGNGPELVVEEHHERDGTIIRIKQNGEKEYVYPDKSNRT